MRATSTAPVTANQTAAVEEEEEAPVVRHDIRKCKSAAEVLEQAGLNYRVSMVPLTYTNPSTGKQAQLMTGHQTVIREDTGEAISVVGSRYTPIQTSDFLARLDPAVKEGKLTFVSALVVGAGRNIVIEAQLPKPIVLKAPNGKDDVLLRRTLYRNSYDGTQPLTLQDYLLRQWCTNGATQILGMEAHRLRHTASADSKYAQILGALEAAMKRFDDVETKAQKLLSTPFTSRMMESVVEAMFPVRAGVKGEDVPARTLNNREMVMSLFSKGQGTFGKTAWDAVNAVTEYHSHHRSVRGGANPDVVRLRSTFLGLSREADGYTQILKAAKL